MGKTPTNTDVQFWRAPDLPGVEVRFSSYNEDSFRSHTHVEYSIGFLESGRTVFLLEDEPQTAVGGQMVLIEPDTAHVCNPDIDSDMTYFMFYIDPAWLSSVASEVLGHKVDKVFFPRPVVDDPALRELWRSLHRAITGGADRLEKESLLVQGLADVISHHAEMGACQEPAGNEDAVRKVKDHLAANLSEKVSLDELSEVAHLSRYHLLRVFQAAVGLPPHAYQNQLRVDLGKKLLAEGMQIAQAAVEAGFVDQSHFSRVFKQYTGATPKQYQTANRA